MARNFVRASAQRINTTFPNLTSQITLAVLFRHSGSVGSGYPNRQTFVTRETGSTINYFLYANTSSIEFAWTSSSNNFHGFAVSHTADQNWHGLAVSHSWGSTASTFVYLDGQALTPASIPTNAVQNITSPTAQSIGSREPATLAEAMNGDIASVAIYETALSEQELKALSNGFSPDGIRPQSLRFFAPLVRNLIDVKGQTLTNTNTAVADHPRVYA